MAIITVTSTADSGEGTLRQAIEDAASGDTIVFDSTTFPANTETVIYLSSAINLSGRDFTVDGGETWTENDVLKTRVVLDAQENSRIITSASFGTTTLNGISFKNGKTTNGGGLYWQISAQAVFNCCVFNSCSAANGGAIYCTGTANLTISNSYFYTCLSTSSGGGIYGLQSSVATLNSCEFNACVSAGIGGGAIFQNTSSATLNNCTFKSCEGTGGGGFCSSTTNKAALNACVFDSCVGTVGGGVYTSGYGVCTLNNCTFRNNATTSNAIDVTSTAASSITINGGTFETSTSSVNIKNGANYSGPLTLEGVINVPQIALAPSSNTIIKGDLTAAVLNASGTLYVTFDGTDRILAVTTSATIGSATFQNAENSSGYFAAPAGTDISAATFTGVKTATYGANVSSVSASIDVDVATVVITSAAAGYIVEASSDGGETWETVTLTDGKTTLTSAKAYQFRTFDGAFVYSSVVPRTYYYTGGTADGDFSTASDWALDVDREVICADAPTIKDGVFYCV